MKVSRIDTGFTECFSLRLYALYSFIWDFEAYWCYSSRAGKASMRDSEMDEDEVLLNSFLWLFGYRSQKPATFLSTMTNFANEFSLLVP